MQLLVCRFWGIGHYPVFQNSLNPKKVLRLRKLKRKEVTRKNEKANGKELCQRLFF